MRKRCPGHLCRFLVVSTMFVLVILSCAPERVDEPYRSTRTFSRYRHALTDLGVDETPIGRLWIAAGEDALSMETLVELPFTDVRIFDPAEPEAAAYRFVTTANRSVSIRLTPDARAPLFFVDLYRIPRNGTDGPVIVASLAPETDTITFRARRSATYLLRIQPEIGRGGRVGVEVDST